MRVVAAVHAFRIGRTRGSCTRASLPGRARPTVRGSSSSSPSAFLDSGEAHGGVRRASPPPALPDRWCVLQAPLAPEIVEPAGDPETRCRSHVALEDFSVVANRLDDFRREVALQAELAAEITFRSEEPPDARVGGARHLFDVGLRNAQLLGVEQREMHPLDDREPLPVTLAHRWTQRLLRYDLGQEDVLFWPRLLHEHAVEARQIRRVRGAPLGKIGPDGLIVPFEGEETVGHAAGLEEACDVELARGAGPHTDSGAVEIADRLDATRGLHHEALPIVVIHSDEREAARAVALARPGRIAHQNVDFSRPQGGKALEPMDRNIVDRQRIPENGRCDCPAVVDVEAPPISLTIGLTEAG